MGLDVTSLYRLKGYRIRLKVDEGEYEGTLMDVIAETSCICLGKVQSLSDQTAFPYLKFYSYEIESWSAIGSPKNEKTTLKKSSNLPEEEGPRLVKLRPLPIHLKDKSNSNIEDKHLLINKNLENDYEDDDYQVPDCESEKDDDDDDDFEPLPDLRFKLPRTTVIVDKIDDNFHEAISFLLKQTLVGICVEGVNIGRHGKICWISICTPKCIYFFDIYILEKEAFDNGLKNFFEKITILKIFHDCRQVSDALFHQYGVKLTNVFDTQVGDVFVHYKKNNRMPNYVRGLGQCLIDYLQLDPKHIHFQRIRENFEEEELTVWTLRPLPKRLEKAAIKHVIYLRDLRVAILEQLLAELNEGIDMYLNILKDCSEEELRLNPSVPHLLPSTFQMLQYRGNKRGFQRFIQPNEKNGFYENKSQIQDPYVTVKKGVWNYNKNPERNEFSNKSLILDNKNVQEKSPPKLNVESQKLSDISLKETNLDNEIKESVNSTKFLYKMVPKQCELKYNAFRNHPKKRIDWPTRTPNSNSESIPSNASSSASSSPTSKGKKEENID